MTNKEQATALAKRFSDVLIAGGARINKKNAIDCALICLREVESALTVYGRKSNELQNMDSEFRLLSGVKSELEKL